MVAAAVHHERLAEVGGREKVQVESRAARDRLGQRVVEMYGDEHAVACLQLKAPVIRSDTDVHDSLSLCLSKSCSAFN